MKKGIRIQNKYLQESQAKLQELLPKARAFDELAEQNRRLTLELESLRSGYAMFLNREIGPTYRNNFNPGQGPNAGF